MSEVVLDQTDAIATAEGEGLVTERFGADFLLIDLDTHYAAQCFLDHIEHFKQNIKDFGDLTIVGYKCWNSKSGYGVHVVVELSYEMPLQDLLIMQSYLGSDVTRDFLSMMRLWQGQTEPRLLFRPEKEKRQRGIFTVKKLVEKLAARRLTNPNNIASIDDDDIPF